MFTKIAKAITDFAKAGAQFFLKTEEGGYLLQEDGGRLIIRIAGSAKNKTDFTKSGKDLTAFTKIGKNE